MLLHRYFSLANYETALMPGVKIGKNVVLGARSLINKDVPENALVAGTPAKVIKKNSYRHVDLAEKIKILTEVINDFAESCNQTIDIKEIKQRIEFHFDNSPFLILHKDGNNDMDLSRVVLNIFFDDVSKEIMKNYPCFSLMTCLCSSVDIIPKHATEWLHFARCIGLRFYPIDEIEPTIGSIEPSL